MKMRQGGGEAINQLKNARASCHPDRALYAKEKCRSCYEKELKRINPSFLARQRANAAAWAKKYQDKKRAGDKKWLARQDPLYRRGIMLKSRFGMTLEEYNTMLNKQNGVCAICHKKSKRNLHVDHCHDSGKIRGLLCFRCNWGLSFFDEDPEILSNAAQYLAASAARPTEDPNQLLLPLS